MNRWKIVLTTLIAVGAIVLLMWMTQGYTEATTRSIIRVTARISCLLFLAAFIASPLKRIWSSPVSSWLMQNRRFLGFSMAVSHSFHAIALICLFQITNGAAPQIDPLSVFGYVLLYSMTITSFKPTADLVGRRSWRILHTTGMSFFWIAFTFEFGRAMMRDTIYVLLTIALIFALLLRLFSFRRSAIVPVTE